MAIRNSRNGSASALEIVFYGWFHQGLPNDPPKLWATPTQELLAALDTAIGAGIVPAMSRRERASLRRWIDKVKLRRPRKAGLRAYQRVTEIGAAPEEVPILMSASIHSAADVMVGGPRELAARMDGRIKAGRVKVLYRAAEAALPAWPVAGKSLDSSAD